MALHSMVTFQNDVITIGGFDGYSSLSALYKMECNNDIPDFFNCFWSKMSQELQIPRHDAVTIFIPNEALLPCT